MAVNNKIVFFPTDWVCYKKQTRVMANKQISKSVPIATFSKGDAKFQNYKKLLKKKENFHIISPQMMFHNY